MSVVPFSRYPPTPGACSCVRIASLLRMRIPCFPAAPPASEFFFIRGPSPWRCLQSGSFQPVLTPFRPSYSECAPSQYQEIQVRKSVNDGLAHITGFDGWLFSTFRPITATMRCGTAWPEMTTKVFLVITFILRRLKAGPTDKCGNP